jgi:hypothetical protein
VYAKSLTKQKEDKDSAAVTLMSTDVDRMVGSVDRTLEIWAQFAQVVIGIWLALRH